MRHSHIRDLTAQLLTEVCPSVEIEPHLQLLSGETFQHRTANADDQARLDVKAIGFWGNRRQSAFFDVRVFNPFAQTYTNQTIQSAYRQNEKDKRRNYGRRIIEIEHGSFTPIVLSATGGMGPSACTAPYSETMKMIRCKFGFSLINSANLCLRGARSALHRLARLDLTDTPIDVIVNEGHF